MNTVLMAISGPSGVGKGTIVKEFLRRRADVGVSVSCTTRAPRACEVNGRDYFFITKEEFLRRKDEGDFLEWDEHFGNYYGTPKSFVESELKTKSLILEIDVVGALNARKHFPECKLIMVTPPSVEELKKRLEGRCSETEEEVQTRLKRLDYELSKAPEYDYILVNDKLESAVDRLEKIYLSLLEKKNEN